jgi:hypothetical protein
MNLIVVLLHIIYFYIIIGFTQLFDFHQTCTSQDQCCPIPQLVVILLF